MIQRRLDSLEEEVPESTAGLNELACCKQDYCQTKVSVRRGLAGTTDDTFSGKSTRYTGRQTHPTPLIYHSIHGSLQWNLRPEFSNPGDGPYDPQQPSNCFLEPPISL
ncbi:hypothetical protein AVEN_184984-1 [Araneus ventricosus]|uniref:Uncharacterized protein n=1 Tax=Araneus ventricosus TaxID=182803 RepID=A0A4Y2N648_ARAVE|nr:hypothetical protein AVEN_184984-1 [Araneus ventricosus]